MVFLEINKKNYDKGSPNLIETVNEHLSNKDDKVFMLIYMEGCMPCNATRPEWTKIENVLSNDFLKNDNILVVSIDKDLVDKLKNYGQEPNSFPTIRFITNAGENIETYEDSEKPEKKDRTIDSFIEWIKHKSGESNITSSERKLGGNRSRKNVGRSRKGRSKRIKYRSKRRWSLKYKNSINCRKPKGFSQKQYCKYGRKI